MSLSVQVMTTLSFEKVVVGVLGAYGTVGAVVIATADDSKLKPIEFRAFTLNEYVCTF